MRFLCSVAATVIAGACGAAWAQAAATVDGQPIDKAQVETYALGVLGYEPEGDALPDWQFRQTLQKSINNRILYLKAKREQPELLSAVENIVQLAIAGEYLAPYRMEFALHRAKREVTVDTVLAVTPPQEDLVHLFQIVFADLETAQRVTGEIERGEITFEAAAAEYSRGFTASRGGEVGGVKPTSTMYAPQMLEQFFAVPLGTRIGPVPTTLGQSLFWVKDRKSGETLRREAAKAQVSEKITERVRQVLWEDAAGYARDNGIRLVLTEESLAGVNQPGFDLDQPAIEAGSRVFTIKDVMSASGGMSHGAKDVLTIAENALRDLSLRELYIERKGDLADVERKRRVLVEHHAARRVLDRAMADLEITDAEIDTYLEEHRGEYRLPDRVDLAIIQVKTEQRLQTVRERLEEGKEFAEVAKAWSLHPSARNGGQVGIVPVGGMTGDVSAGQTGLLSEPLHVEEGEGAGYYLLNVREFLPARDPVAAELDPATKGGIRAKLMAEKRSRALAGYMQAAYKEVDVEIL